MRVEDVSAIAASLVANRDGPFGQFPVAEVRKFILGCIFKAKRLLNSSEYLFSTDPGDIAATTIAVICKNYDETKVKSFPELQALAKKILRNDFIDLYTKKKKEGLEELSPPWSASDDSRDDTVLDLDSQADEQSPEGDPYRAEHDMVSRISARQKLDELERKIKDGVAKFGAEFGDLVETLLTAEGSAAIHGIDQFDRPLINKVRASQGRTKISKAQLERYIKYLRSAVSDLLEDDDHERAPANESSKRSKKN